MKLKGLSFRRLVLSIIIITPFIDIINALLKIKGVSSTISFGQLIRSLIIVLMLFFLGKKSRKKFVLVFLLIGVLFIRDIFYSLFYDAPLLANFIIGFRYIYVLTFGFLIGSGYEKGVLNLSEIYIYTRQSVTIFAVVTVIANTLGYGISYVSTTRLFTEVNALTAILVMASAVWLYELFLCKFSIKNAVLAGVALYATFSQATKTGLFGVVVLFAYLLVYAGIVKRRIVKGILIIIVGFIGALFIYGFYLNGSGIDIYKRWQFFYNNQDLLTFLLSGRNYLFSTIFNIWKKNIVFVIFGMSGGYANQYILEHYTVNYAGAEMDLFDIGFYYGIIIMIFVALKIGKRFLNSLRGIIKKENGYFNFLFVIFCIISFLGSHVLNSPMAGVFFAISYIFTFQPSMAKRIMEIETDGIDCRGQIISEREGE